MWVVTFTPRLHCPWGKTHSTRWILSWVGPSASLDAARMRKSLASVWKWTLIPWPSSLYPVTIPSYPGSSIQAVQSILSKSYTDCLPDILTKIGHCIFLETPCNTYVPGILQQVTLLYTTRHNTWNLWFSLHYKSQKLREVFGPIYLSCINYMCISRRQILPQQPMPSSSQ
jgi:hypothetical protein